MYKLLLAKTPKVVNRVLTSSLYLSPSVIESIAPIIIPTPISGLGKERTLDLVGLRSLLSFF